MQIYFTEEEYVDLVTSYDFLTQLEFKTKEEVESAFLFFQEYDRLTQDVQDYLLDIMNQLPTDELETTESNQDWKITGASAN